MNKTKRSRHANVLPEMEKALQSMLSKPPLEKVIEEKIRKYALSRGCLCDKLTSPTRRSVPDRIITVPGPFGSAVTGYLEVKRGGQKPTKQQTYEIDKLRGLGALVRYVDSSEAGCRFVDFLILLS